MKIVCAYTLSGLTNQTKVALAPYSVRWCLMENDNDYAWLMAYLWGQGESFINVEHDIEPWPGALEQLQDCPNAWCAYEYRMNGGFIAGIGCCKFGADLLVQYPTAMEEANNLEDRTHPKGHWCAIDIRLQGLLRGAGYDQCIHTPRVNHVNHWQSHRCW